MTQVSKYLISDDVYKRCWEIFAKTLIGIRSSKDFQDVVEDLFTPTERIMLAKRLSIALLLMQGYEYREISKVLRVSFPTISAINMKLKYNSGYKKSIGKILKDEKFIDYFNKVAQAVVSMGTVGKGSGVWRSLKRELEKKSKEKPF